MTLALSYIQHNTVGMCRHLYPRTQLHRPTEPTYLTLFQASRLPIPLIYFCERLDLKVQIFSLLRW